MSVSTSRVAPKDPRARPGGTRSLWRLRGYLRPYRAHLAVMGSTALVGVFVSLSIPLVTKSIIDGPIAEHRSGEILPLGLLALALGITEAALILIRRWVQARAVLGFETAVRKDLYRRMQALPMEFAMEAQKLVAIAERLSEQVRQEAAAVREASEATKN